MKDILAQPGWSEHRIHKTPDDQILVFWAQTVRLRIVSRIFVKKNERYCHSIIDKNGQEVGTTGVHNAGAMQAKPVEADFIMIASQVGLGVPDSKIVLHVTWDDGIYRRVNIGEINADAWEQAKPRRILVLLG